MTLPISYRRRKIEGLFGYYPIGVLTPAALEKQIEKATLPNYKKVLDKLDLILPINSAVGIEIEAEQVHPALAGMARIPGWTVATDTSLRNSGREFISVPTRTDAVNKSLATIFSLFQSYPVDFSWRTSEHVHLNLREDTVETLMNLVILYTLSEDALFEFIGEERRHSNFCVPIQETNLAYYISQVIYGNSRLPDMIAHWQKYTALNLRPLCYNDHGGPGSAGNGKGTVEFRHMSGNKDVTKLVTWINLILSLQQRARTTTLAELEEKVLAVNTREDYVSLIRWIFGPMAAHVPTRDFRRILYSSIAYAKECFCPVLDIYKLAKIGSKRTTGLSEMIKIRTRYKKEEEKPVRIRTTLLHD